MMIGWRLTIKNVDFTIKNGRTQGRNFMGFPMGSDPTTLASISDPSFRVIHDMSPPFNEENMMHDELSISWCQHFGGAGHGCTNWWMERDMCSFKRWVIHKWEVVFISFVGAIELAAHFFLFNSFLKCSSVNPKTWFPSSNLQPEDWLPSRRSPWGWGSVKKCYVCGYFRVRIFH